MIGIKLGLGLSQQGGGGGVVPPPVVPAIWDSSKKGSLLALSGGNLTVTHDATTNWSTVKSNNPAMPKQTHATYFEVLIGGSVGNVMVGIANIRDVVDGFYPGQTGGAAICYGTTGVMFNNINNNGNGVVMVGSAFTVGDVVGVAFTSTKIWFRKNGGNWNNDVIGNQNPATGTGGKLHQVSDYIYACVGINTPNSAATVRFDSASWTGTAPSGFSSFPAYAQPAVSGAIWGTAVKSAALTVMGVSNTTLRHTGATAEASLLGASYPTAGENIYFEAACDCSNTDAMFGIGSVGINVNTYLGGNNFSCAYLVNGAFYSNGGNQGASGLGVYTDGDIIRVACSPTKIWFARSGGQWNGNNAANDPATNLGGFALASSVTNRYPAGRMVTLNDYTFAYFNASEWTYSAPSGFSALAP